jgi:hypothetical protein
MVKHVEPTVRQAAFSCPHCGAYTSQTWFELHAKDRGDKDPLPWIPNGEDRFRLEQNRDIPEESKASVYEWFDQIKSGLVFVEQTKEGTYCDHTTTNLHLSKCYVCKKIAVWVHEALVFPASKFDVPPNADLPDSIKKDFEEARRIVDGSPRGAAALLRLCVQKLCKHLGKPGKNIDDDIGSLVKDGLNPLVQQSLDIVRVVGNESVHPGTIDLNDDKDTAIRLFELVNAIADQMISHPKNVKEMYSKLPELKRKAIEKRDSKVS